MKKIAIIIFLCAYLGANAQQKNDAPPRPAIPVNSLQLNIKLIKGKELYSFIEKEKTIKNNEKYSIKFHKEVAKKKYKIGYNVEGDDIVPSSSNFLKGKYTGFANIGSFKDGYKNGIWKTTYYRNKLVKTINYSKGLVIGRYRVYNTSGDLLYKTTFGKKGNGKFKDYYYKTGVLKVEGNYENGKKEGDWCYYDEQGNTKEIIYYKNGTPIKK